MFFKTIAVRCSILMLLVVSGVASAASRMVIDVVEVGLSKNTNRVFIKGDQTAEGTSCEDGKVYSMLLEGPEAYLFYSAALTAMNEGRKMRVQYEQDACINGAAKVDVFWNL
ncbi:hypothetical protein [Agaribacterium sp. ZY112]|uniref:hypothetical protein n=1 Tax=Agaribacterium sp. ZY112 TaxID=3233574 RepID=UPI003524F635